MKINKYEIYSFFKEVKMDLGEALRKSSDDERDDEGQEDEVYPGRMLR